MFNIDFHGSNCAQKEVARFKVASGMKTLCCSEGDKEKLLSFLKDVREMDSMEFNTVIFEINSILG